MSLFASLMENRTMTYEEILSHSLPFLNAFNNNISRLRIIEAGGIPEGEENQNTADSEFESPLSSGDFFNMVNGVWD